MYSDDEAAGGSLGADVSGTNSENASANDPDSGVEASEYSVYDTNACDAGDAGECGHV